MELGACHIVGRVEAWALCAGSPELTPRKRLKVWLAAGATTPMTVRKVANGGCCHHPTAASQLLLGFWCREIKCLDCMCHVGGRRLSPASTFQIPHRTSHQCKPALTQNASCKRSVEMSSFFASQSLCDRKAYQKVGMKVGYQIAVFTTFTSLARQYAYTKFYPFITFCITIATIIH